MANSDSCCNAGLTNALFMKEHGVLIQLLPYGWEIKPGQVIRAAFNQDYAMLKQGHYLQVTATDICVAALVWVCC